MKRIFKVYLLCATVLSLPSSWATEQDATKSLGNTLEHKETIPDIAKLDSNIKGELLAHDADLFEAFEKSEGLSDISPDDLASFDEPFDSDDS